MKFILVFSKFYDNMNKSVLCFLFSLSRKNEMNEKKEKTFRMCITESCVGKANARGLCLNCYTAAIRIMKSKGLQWYDLEQLGMSLPAKRKRLVGPSLFKEKLEVALNQSRQVFAPPIEPAELDQPTVPVTQDQPLPPYTVPELVNGIYEADGVSEAASVPTPRGQQFEEGIVPSALSFPEFQTPTKPAETVGSVPGPDDPTCSGINRPGGIQLPQVDLSRVNVSGSELESDKEKSLAAEPTFTIGPPITPEIKAARERDPVALNGKLVEDYDPDAPGLSDKEKPLAAEQASRVPLEPQSFPAPPTQIPGQEG